LSVVSGSPPGDGELVAVGLMEPLLFDYKEA
jgi:hypothetical protein